MKRRQDLNGSKGRSRPRRRGQGTLEYIMLLTVILIALVAVMTTAFSNSVKNVINRSGDAVNAAGNKIKTGLVGLTP